MACREGQDPDAPAVQYPLLRAVQRLRSAREGGRVPQAQTHNTDMADAMLSMQASLNLTDFCPTSHCYTQLPMGSEAAASPYRDGDPHSAVSVRA